MRFTPDLDTALADAMAQRPPRLRVDLDPGGVVSAAAISVLLDAAAASAATGIAYEVVCRSAVRTRLLGALGLTDALGLRADEASTSGCDG